MRGFVPMALPAGPGRMRFGHHALAAERIAGIDLRAGAGVFRPGIDFPGRFDLLRRQAGAGLRLAPAGERGDVEAACGRVGDDPVGDAVDRVAGRDDLAVEEQQIVVRQYLPTRSEEHTSELQSLMRISYAVFCLKKKIK